MSREELRLMTKMSLEKEIEKYEDKQWQLDMIDNWDKSTRDKYDYYSKKIKELKKLLKETK